MPIALALLLATTGTAAAAPRVFDIEGVITDAEFLSFAVLDGELIAANPLPGDLPLGYTARLTYDDMTETAGFEFSGRFDSPNRSYAFDFTLDGLFASTGLDDTSIRIDDPLASFALDASLDGIGSGSWTWTDERAVGVFPPLDRVVEADISSVSEVPLPAAGLLLLSALGAVGALGARSAQRQLA